MTEALAGRRVLIVDDHADTRDIYEQCLGATGAIVLTAGTAEDAVERLDRVDVVVTDFALPGEDGVWLLDRINASPRPVPVILLSGFAETQIKAVAAAPFARKLLKPVDPWDLAVEIGRLLGTTAAE
jgi:two-component system, OmpR family, response regulator